MTILICAASAAPSPVMHLPWAFGGAGVTRCYSCWCWCWGDRLIARTMRSPGGSQA
jgi:hypothetical protein